MICDLMRSCYTRNMRFVAGQPAILVPATWYFTAPTAKVFPFENSFFSANWNSVHPTASDLGDQDGATRRYYNGRRLNRSDGTSFAGPAAFFRDGCPALTGIPRAEDGTPRQCLPAPYGLAGGGLAVPVVPLKGGKVVGGQATVPVTPGLPCSFCTGTTPLTIVLHIAGASGPDAGANGDWPLAQDPIHPCVWSATISGPYFLGVTRLGTGNYQIAVSDLFPFAATYTGAASGCTDPQTIAIDAPSGGWPPTMSITFL